MKNWLITSTDSEELSKQTNIIYKSKYTNLLGVETELSKEQLLKIEGVLTVEEAATGHFNGQNEKVLIKGNVAWIFENGALVDAQRIR